MAEKNEHAVDYVHTFYRRYDLILQNVRDAALLGATAYNARMLEPGCRNLGSEVGLEVLTVAITCVPGGLFLNQAWIVTKNSRKLFAAGAEFCASRGVDIGKSLLKLGWAKGSSEPKALEHSFSGVLQKSLLDIYGSLSNSRKRLAMEQEAVENTLLYDLNKPEVQRKLGVNDPVAGIHKVLGELPEIPGDKELFALANNYEALIFKAYTRYNVVVHVDWIDEGRPMEGKKWSIMSGFNREQAQYVLTSFQDVNPQKIGCIYDIQDLYTEWGASIGKNFFERGRMKPPVPPTTPKPRDQKTGWPDRSNPGEGKPG